VVLKGDANDGLKQLLRDHVADAIGAIARPESIRFAHALPKTRSGKIMRRLLRDIAADKTIDQDTSTLEESSVITQLKEDAQ